MRYRRKRPGLTLLELLCVLAILVILLSVVYPSIEGMYGQVRLTAGADQVRSAFAEARAHAIEDGQAYRFAVKPGQADFRVAPDQPEHWEGGDGPASGSGRAAYTFADHLPKGVTFRFSGNDASSWAKVATFLPDGTCGDDTEVELHASGCRPIRFRVRALTGAVRVRTLSAEDR